MPLAYLTPALEQAEVPTGRMPSLPAYATPLFLPFSAAPLSFRRRTIQLASYPPQLCS